MLANVYTKSLRDRWATALVAAIGVALFFLMGAAVYRDVDTSFYYDLPRAMLDLIGVPAEGGVAGIAFGAIYTLIGAFVLAGIAIGSGASSIAGEEADGTLGLLLGNPVSRRGVLVSKAVSMITVIGAMTLLLWAAGSLVPVWLDIDMTGIHVEALVLALFLNALVYGFMAMAIGSWTGSRNAASSVSVAVMVVGYLASGLLPLIDSIDWVARLFPWWYFNGSTPLANGVDAVHTTVMISLVVAGFVVAYVGVGRRDLNEKTAGKTILDRLRTHPLTRKIIERVAGTARVSRISIKTTSEFQGLLTISAAVMFYMGVLIPILYNFLPDDFVTIMGQFPDAVLALVGGIDMSTATGFLNGEVFSLVGPIALLALTISMGSRALAGEEEKRTMGLLLANPVSRAQVIREKVIAMVIHGVALGVATFLGTGIGVLISGLDEVTISGIASLSVMLVLLGLVFGGVALTVGAATGRTRVASLVATGAAVVAYFVFSFFPLSATFEGWVVLSPFHYYLGDDPLLNGIDWSDAVTLAGLAVILFVVSVPLFNRRDLRG